MSVNVAFSGFMRVSKFVNNVVFGKKHLLLTNALISTAMGALGDGIQQNYDLMTDKLKGTNREKYNWTRTYHMSAAGLTTGVVSHYWYIFLDRRFGAERVVKLVIKKILWDQIFFSPVNLVVYFTTVGLLERAKMSRIKDEIVEKGFENIYVVEWAIWPPAQFINFYLLPLKYRILFDNIISLGFDIYSPFVKYKTQLKEEKKKIE